MKNKLPKSSQDILEFWTWLKDKYGVWLLHEYWSYLHEQETKK